MSNRNKANPPGKQLVPSKLDTAPIQEPTTEPVEPTQESVESLVTEALNQAATDTSKETLEPNPQDPATDPLAQAKEAPVQDTGKEAVQETVTPEPKPLTEQEQATETIKALALSQPAIKLDDSPVSRDPVHVEVSRKETPAGRELGYSPDVREASFEAIVEQATLSNKIVIMITSEQLEVHVKRFSPRTASSVDQAAKDMVALYSFLLNLLNTDKSIEEFNAQWRLVTETFKANQGDALSEARLYRGTQHWPKSHEDMKLYQSILNMIRVGNMYGKEDIHKQINFRNFEVTALSDQGRGRLMQYYS